MPRSNGVYSEPAGTKATPNTTIQSAPYNALVDDLVADANAPRPLTAGGTGATNPTAARESLGLKIGTNVQAYDPALQSIAGLVTTANMMAYTTDTDLWATTALTPFCRTILDDVDAAAVRATLGLGSLATLNTVNDGNWSGADLAVANGGTGASSAEAARSNLSVYSKTETDTAVSSAANAKVSKAGDIMTGILELRRAGSATLTFHVPGARQRYLSQLEDGRFIFQDQGGSVLFQISDIGQIYTLELGDLKTHIEARASAQGLAWANDRVARLAVRKVSEGALSIPAAFTDQRAPTGAVITGYSTNSAGGVTRFLYKYIQLYDPVRGWLGASDE